MGKRFLRGDFVCFVLAVLLFGFAAWQCGYSSGSKTVTPEQQIAEQNRQSAVATELGQAEIGDIAEMKDGLLCAITKIFPDTLTLSCGPESRQTGYFKKELANRINKIIKYDPSDPSNYARAAHMQIRGERMK